MNRLIRTSLLFLSFVAFLLLAPVVILYALGYRSLSPTVDPVPVGVVLVESQPVRGDVSVNGQFVGRAPEAITDISDSAVRITVSADGYETWEKVVPVAPGQATEVRDVRLFPSERTASLVAADVATFSLSPDRALLAVAGEDTAISIYDEANGVVINGGRLGAPPTSLLWAPESTALLVIDTHGRHWFLEIKSGAKLVRIPALAGAENITWHPRFSNRLLFTSPAGVLTSLDLDTSRALVIAENVKTYATSERTLYLHRTSGGIGLVSFEGAPKDVLQPPTDVAIEQLLVTPRGNIAWRDDENRVWALHPDDSIREVARGVARVGWSPDGKMLLVLTHDNTLFVYNLFDERAVVPLEELHLVARLSRTITEPQWFSGDRHIIYQVQDEILVTEIDTRDHPITYQVDTTNTGAAAPTVGEAGEVIFYLKRQGDRLNLLRLPLVVDRDQ